MTNYYINKQPQVNGEHEVHKYECTYLPNELNREFLGNFSNCKDAVKEARKRYSNVDGCFYCSNECHKK